MKDFEETKALEASEMFARSVRAGIVSTSEIVAALELGSEMWTPVCEAWLAMESPSVIAAALKDSTTDVRYWMLQMRPDLANNVFAPLLDAELFLGHSTQWNLRFEDQPFSLAAKIVLAHTWAYVRTRDLVRRLERMDNVEPEDAQVLRAIAAKFLVDEPDITAGPRSQRGPWDEAARAFRGQLARLGLTGD